MVRSSVLWICMGALLGFAVVYPFHIPISYFETDFLDYCIGVESMDHIRLRTPYKRSAFAGILPYVLSNFLGVINGIALSSLICYIGILCVAVRWVYEVTKEAISIPIVVTLFLMMGPVLSVSRMLNFYPEIIVALFLGSYLVFRALRTPNKYSLMWVSCAISLAFLVDVRGFLWGLCFAGLWGLTLVWTKKDRMQALLLSAVPLYLGWKIGGWAYHRHHSPLSRQLDVRPLYNKIEPENPLYAPPYEYPEGFLWGRSSVQDFWDELLFLIEQALMSTPQGFYEFSKVSDGVYRYWFFWVSALACSFLWFGWRKRPGSGISALALLPFLYSLWKLPDVVEPHIRFYAQCMPALLVLISIALTDVCKRYTHRVWAPILGVLVLVSLYAVPKWGVSRVILNAHVEMSIPEAKEIYKKNNLIRGYEVHLYVSPITKQEAFLQSTWFEYCNTRLKKDNVVVPFYQRLNHE